MPTFQHGERSLSYLDEGQGPPVVLLHSGGLSSRQWGKLVARLRTSFEPVTFGVLHDPLDAEGLADLARIDPDGTFFDDATGGQESWLTRFVSYWNGEGAWGALPEPSRENFRKVGRKLFQEVRSLLHDRTPASAYRALQMPTLLLHGTVSPHAAHRVCQRLAEALPRASRRPIEGAGHMGPISHPAAVNEAIAAHLDARAL